MEHADALAGFEIGLFVAAATVMGLGGFVKGAVGFALPMISIAGLGSFLTAQEAVAVLIIPTFLSNLWQTLRQGPLAAIWTLKEFWRLNIMMALTIGVVAQLVPRISSGTLFVTLGVVVTVAAGLQLWGWRPQAPKTGPGRTASEVAAGLIAGITGGISGVWGPPVLFFLIALATPKIEMIRAQGIAYLLGSVILVGAHLQSGLLNAVTIPFSLAMCLPVAAGMALGLAVQDRLDQRLFRRMTLAVLCIAGLNLLRRGLF
ncbi:sulfite exporter TauE/SafE family protein [Thermohalobaculum xanthum]|nr:sulfite exporter TauE/SafE family protein [Thermohalobaculum xanthum]